MTSDYLDSDEFYAEAVNEWVAGGCVSITQAAMSVVVRRLVRMLIREAIRAAICSATLCDECFGTGLRGGFQVRCSKGHPLMASVQPPGTHKPAAREPDPSPPEAPRNACR